MPFSGMGLPGANPRAPPSQGQPPRGSYGGNDGYGASQGYADAPRGQGYGGGGGYDRPSEKGPSRPSGGGRRVPLRVEKVTDKSLQSRLIYGNL